MEKKKAMIIINEQHSLLEEQEAILNDKFSEYGFWKIPAEGLTYSEISSDVSELLAFVQEGGAVIFVSPIPLMIGWLTHAVITWHYNEGHVDEETVPEPSVFLFHNDRREKRELPNGKVIMTVAKTGWQLMVLA